MGATLWRLLRATPTMLNERPKHCIHARLVLRPGAPEPIDDFGIKTQRDRSLPDRLYQVARLEPTRLRRRIVRIPHSATVRLLVSHLPEARPGSPLSTRRLVRPSLPFSGFLRGGTSHAHRALPCGRK